MIKRGDIFRYTSMVGNYKNYYERILQSGHIKLVGHVNKTPLTFIRPHSFNPKLRNIPMRRNKLICPYRTPKLYEHEQF